MTTENASTPADTAGASTENTSSNVDTSVNQTADTAANAIEPAKTAAGTTPAPGTPAAAANPASATTPVVGADGKVAYVPNFKYKAALQEKELDPFFHSLIKDADSEKKVKELFTKVDAFDFIKQKKEHAEQQFQSLANDYETVSGTVTKFNNSVKQGDLSSAFRLAGISKEQIFKWTQQQLQLMEMPPEQRAQYEQHEQTRLQKSELEERVTQLQTQFESQAVQSRTMQLEVALSRPEVSKFAEAWDKNGEPGAFKNFVVEEAQKIYYTTGKDISPEQAVNLVMQRFGKFLSTGETVVPASQAPNSPQAQRQAPPVIPNVTGKAASPIKKVPRNLDDLKKLARDARD